jgi:hypothetical protein
MIQLQFKSRFATPLTIFTDDTPHTSKLLIDCFKNVGCRVCYPAHHYFGIEKVKGEVETRMNLLK